MKIWMISLLIILIVVGAILLFSSFYVLDQTQQAVVLRFGKIVAVETEPGLHFKQPFVDNVVRFDKRILLYDIEPEKIIAADKKTLVIDTYVLWRIKDAEAFIKSLKSVKLALPRIDDVVYSHVRNIFAKANFDEIISEKREDLLREVTALSREDLKDFGIEVVDVRVKHADLPAENEKAVYERMKAERYSIAAQIRAEGEKEARKIRAEADKTAKVLIAEAQSKAEGNRRSKRGEDLRGGVFKRQGLLRILENDGGLQIHRERNSHNWRRTRCTEIPQNEVRESSLTSFSESYSR